MSRSLNPESPRILIIRCTAIGDTVMTLPVLNALRDQFPRAMLAWLVAEHCAPIVRGHKSLDELVVVPRRGWRSLLALRKQLQALRLDVAIDVQGLAKSAIPAWVSGAPRRIGFVRGRYEGREFSALLNNELVAPTRTHAVDRYLELLAPLGISEPKVRFELPTQADEEAAIEIHLQSLGLEGGFVVLAVGAGRSFKQWPLERHAGVIRHLSDTHGLRTLLPWGDEREHHEASRLAHLAEGAAVVAPPLTLTALAQFCRRAHFFVGGDTGPTHIAAASGVPCVALFGPTPASRCAPYGDGHVVVSRWPEERLGNRRCTTLEPMRAISIDDACEACDRVVEAERQRATAGRVLDYLAPRTGRLHDPRSQRRAA